MYMAHCAVIFAIAQLSCIFMWVRDLQLGISTVELDRHNAMLSSARKHSKP